MRTCHEISRQFYVLTRDWTCLKVKHWYFVVILIFIYGLVRIIYQNYETVQYKTETSKTKSVLGTKTSLQNHATAPSVLLLVLTMNCVSPPGGWLETGVRAPSPVAEASSRGTWCVFTTCRTAPSSTPGTSTARGPNPPPCWAARAVSASACGKLQSGPRYSGPPPHPCRGRRGRSVHRGGHHVFQLPSVLGAQATLSWQLFAL